MLLIRSSRLRRKNVDQKYKKVSVTDPDATMATTARNRRVEPAYKQHTAVDDKFDIVEPQVDEVSATAGVKKECSRRSLKGDCLSKGRANKAVVVGDDYPALGRAWRRRERWSQDDQRLYQRHRWRSEGFHGEAKTWHGLARAIRRGLAKIWRPLSLLFFRYFAFWRRPRWSDHAASSDFVVGLR